MIQRPVRLRLSARFLKSYKKLGQPLTGRIDRALNKFQTNPESPGLNFEPIKGSPKDFTIRVDRNFRILLVAQQDEIGPYFLVADVASHDDAYS